MMRTKKAARTGFVLITTSTVLAVLALVIVLAGAFYESQVRYDEDDLSVQGDSGSLTLEGSFISVLQLQVDSEEDIRVRLKVTNEDSGEEVLNERGSTPMRQQVPLEGGGDFRLSVEVLSGGSMEDLELEVSISSGTMLASCCFGGGICIAGLLSFIIGTVMIIVAFAGRRKRRRSG